MQSSRRSKRVYHVPQPAVPRASGENVLQRVALPAATGGNGDDSDENDKARRQLGIARGTNASTRFSRARGGSSDIPVTTSPEGCRANVDALAFIRDLDTTKLTDGDAESIAYPYHPYAYTWDDVHAALQARLCSTAARVAWNAPRERPGWDTDLRFLGDWWISLRDLDSAISQTTRLGMRVVDLDAPATELRSKKGEVNRPFLRPDERVAWAEDQLVADFALRLHGRLFRLETLHFDELALTPDRMHVLMFAGVRAVGQSEARALAAKVEAVEQESREEEKLRTEASEAAIRFGAWHVSFSCGGNASPRSIVERGSGHLSPKESPQVKLCDAECSATGMGCATVLTQFLLETLSFSICSIGTASALVLLVSLAAIAQDQEHEEEHARRRKGHPAASGTLKRITNLDLSYNALSSASLYCLTALLPQTHIRRLSLRGNRLTGGDSAATRDFLLEGCLDLEELDLSDTALSVQQVSILIEVLPALPKLRALHLNGIHIPAEKTVSLSRAVYQSKLWSISLHGCATCAGSAYMNFIHAACEQHKARATGSADATGTNTASFFDLFFSRSLTRGWVPPELRALPAGYGPFTNNDPSLFERAHP